MTYFSFTGRTCVVITFLLFFQELHSQLQPKHFDSHGRPIYQTQLSEGNVVFQLGSGAQMPAHVLRDSTSGVPIPASFIGAKYHFSAVPESAEKMRESKRRSRKYNLYGVASSVGGFTLAAIVGGTTSDKVAGPVVPIVMFSGLGAHIYFILANRKKTREEFKSSIGLFNEHQSKYLPAYDMVSKVPLETSIHFQSTFELVQSSRSGYTYFNREKIKTFSVGPNGAKKKPTYHNLKTYLKSTPESKHLFQRAKWHRLGRTLGIVSMLYFSLPAPSEAVGLTPNQGYLVALGGIGLTCLKSPRKIKMDAIRAYNRAQYKTEPTSLKSNENKLDLQGLAYNQWKVQNMVYRGLTIGWRIGG